MYASIPSLLSLPPTHCHPSPLGHHGASSWAPCVTRQLPSSYLICWWRCICWCCPPHPPLPSLPPVPRVCSPHQRLFSCLKIGSSVPFFSTPHKGINILYCSSLPDLLHLYFWQDGRPGALNYISNEESLKYEMISFFNNMIPIFFHLLFGPHHTACGTLALWPGIEPWPLAVETWIPNHRIIREVPEMKYLKSIF